MKKILTVPAFAIALQFSSGANAELVSTDYLSNGDDLVTLDTNTGLEWLDLTVTKYMSMASASSAFVGDSTQTGWRLPTEEEVAILFRSVFYPDITTENYGGTVVNTDDISRIASIANMLGTSGVSGNAYFTLGLHNSSSGVAASGFYKVGNNQEGSGSYVAYENWMAGNLSVTIKDPSIGVWLVSDGGASFGSVNDPNISQYQDSAVSDVPAPAILSGLGFLLFGLRKKFI